MQPESFVALESLAQGAVAERFSEEFQQLLLNIVDENTDPKAKRKLVIELELTPNEHRNWADYKLKVQTKLAPHEPTLGVFSIGRLGSRVEATEVVAEQQPLFSEIHSES